MSDTDLYYEAAGQGPPALLIQGVGIAGCGWRPQVDGLRDALELAWFDNRGIGASPGRPGSMEDMARDALSVMDALGWERAALVGHSMGGVIAQAVATLAPERVTRLALLCTLSRGSAAVASPPSTICLNLRTLIGTRASRRRAFFELVSAPDIPPEEANIALLEEAFGRDLTDLPPATPAQMMALVRADLREQLSALQIPSLVISATHDRIATVAQGRMLSEVLRGQFVEVPGGHAVTVQDAGRINALLRSFLLAD